MHSSGGGGGGGSGGGYSTSTYSSLSGSEASEPAARRRLVRHSSLETVDTNVTAADEFVWVDSHNRYFSFSINIIHYTIYHIQESIKIFFVIAVAKMRFTRDVWWCKPTDFSLTIIHTLFSHNVSEAHFLYNQLYFLNHLLFIYTFTAIQILVNNFNPCNLPRLSFVLK